MSGWAVADDRVEYFETHIRPVFVEHCLECHRADADELGGNLSLESAAAIMAGGDSGAAVVPGEPDSSPLIEAMRYDGLEMPPSGKLPDDVVAKFEKWVRDGAVDPRRGTAPAVRSQSGIDIKKGKEFWAFRPLQSPSFADAGENAIDVLLSKKRNEAGLGKPSIASPEVQLRRLSFDLTGLPPSPEQIRRWTSEPSDENWRAIVDEYLATDSFGEHWARMWLDLARYADSNGSDFNATHHDAWRYRDYVIDSYNADRPYNEFVMEQLAGDLLPYETDAERSRKIVATSFLALGAKMLSERDKDKLALDIVDEQIDTVGKAMLGLTLGCARCHDHKFDPVSTSDYYALAGIFQSTETVDGEIIRYVSDLIRVPLPVSPEEAAAAAEYQVKKKQLADRKSNIEKQLAAMRSTAALSNWLKLGVVVDNDAAVLTGEWKESTFSKSRLGPNYVHNDQSTEVLTATYQTKLESPGEYEVRVSYSAAGARASNVPVTIQTADGPVEIVLDQTKKPKLADVLQPIGRFQFGSEAKVVISTAGTKGYVIADAIQLVPVADADAVPPAAVDDAELVAKRKVIEQELKELAASAPPALPTALSVRDVEKPADCAIRIRGEAHREGDPVPRGFIQVAMTSEPPAMPADESGRAELAQWIASAENPLTARVYVNRVWSNLFGEGLVRTPHNFGELGERPTHPELLDWLALRFIESDWSTKALVREIVLTDAYRASSEVSNVAAEKDPENRLWTRAKRRPLTAEQIRDSLLQVAGRLDRSRPADPMQGIGKLISRNNNDSGSAKAKSSKDTRTIYMPIVRNELPEVLTTFDFADPEVSVGKRSTTNVPGQALFLMNSEFVRETALNVAKSAINEPDPIASVYLKILNREPDTDVYAELREFVADYADLATGLEALCHVLLASTDFRVLE